MTVEREEAMMRELLRVAIEPPSPGLTERVLAAVAESPDERRDQGPHWALSLVAAVLAVTLVATLALAVRLTHREGGVPAAQGSQYAGSGIPVAGTGARAFPTAGSGAWLAQRAAGGTTTLYQTADGGRTWTARFSYPGDLPDQVLMDPTGAGIVVGGQRNGAVPVLFRTADDGATWQRAALPALAAAWGVPSFADATHGWVLASLGPGRAEILSTADGGLSWSGAPEFNDRANFPGISSTQLRILWAAGGRGLVVPPTGAGTAPVHVFVTDDGGASWRSSFPYSPGPDVTSANVRLDARLLPDGRTVLFMERVDARGRGAGLSVAVSADAGRTWSRPVHADGSSGGRALFALDEAHWWLSTGGGGDLRATDDGGRSIRRAGSLPAGYAFQSIAFSTAAEGWAVGTAGGRTSVFVSHDGGAHWEAVQPPA